MNGWIRQVSPVEDPAILALGDGVAGLRMAFCLIQLRCFCSANKRNGLFATGRDFAGQVERAAGWRGKRGALVEALLEVGALRGSHERGFQVVNNGLWGSGEAPDEGSGMPEPPEVPVWTPVPPASMPTPTASPAPTPTPAPPQTPIPAPEGSLSFGDEAGEAEEVRRARNRERTARWRARKKAVTPESVTDSVTVTPCDASDSVTVTPCDASDQGQKTARVRAGETKTKTKDKDKDLKTTSNKHLQTAYSQAEFETARAGAQALADAEKSEIFSQKNPEKISESAQAVTPPAPGGHNPEPVRPSAPVPAQRPPQPQDNAPAAPNAPAQTPAPAPDPAFEAFWEAYPVNKRKGRQAAFAAWRELSGSGALPPLRELFTRLWLQAQSKSWQQEGGRYIPQPVSWLATSRWETVLPGEPQTITETGRRMIQASLDRAGSRRPSAPPPSCPPEDVAFEAEALATLRAERAAHPQDDFQRPRTSWRPLPARKPGSYDVARAIYEECNRDNPNALPWETYKAQMDAELAANRPQRGSA